MHNELYTTDYDVEKKFIDVITTNWYKYNKLASYEELVANFREKLNLLNKEVLGNAPLTNTEFKEILMYLEKQSVFEASQILRTGKIDVVCFHKQLLEYADILQTDTKVVITGRIQHRGEDQTSVLIENVKSVDNSNILTLSLLEEIKYEELCGIKNILAKYHGEDPVMIKLPPMTSSIFWVKTSNDLINNLKQVFPNKLDIKIDSLDRPLSV